VRSSDSFMKHRCLSGAVGIVVALGCLATGAPAWAQKSDAGQLAEEYRSVLMPPGFRIEKTELDGPVFADPEGRTIYKWPLIQQRSGQAGEVKGAINCYGEKATVTTGNMSPYPPGLLLPDLANRPACTDLWKPVPVADGAEEIGEWTILQRKDGLRQWAYQEQALYTSVRDRGPGDVISGGTRRSDGLDSPAFRMPIQPPPQIPPGFDIKTTVNGRLLVTDKGFSVYTYKKDTAQKAACDGPCLRDWQPVLAPLGVNARGNWTLLQRAPGVRQWVFHGKPLYTYKKDSDTWSVRGGDVPDWSNVYTQLAPPPPSEFTVQDTLQGQVLADAKGKTVYVYKCTDDAADQLSCDFPGDTLVYRNAVCGGGSRSACLELWPYVQASADAKNTSKTWTVEYIDPMTGAYAKAGDAGALRVWAYLGRPLYTYARDKRPGDVFGDGEGEARGRRNGHKAFWLRDDYFSNTL